MKNEPNSKILRLALVCSIILNLAFIGGFVIKRAISSNIDSSLDSSAKEDFKCPPSETKGEDNKYHRDKDSLGIGKLCKENPAFYKLHHEHGKKIHDNMEKMYLLRKEMLEKIKGGANDEKDFEGIIAEFNVMNSRLEMDNVRHLLSLKKILEKEAFNSLIDRLIYKLSTHKNSLKRFVGYNKTDKTENKTK
jgi:hypothetical protein